MGLLITASILTVVFAILVIVVVSWKIQRNDISRSHYLWVFASPICFAILFAGMFVKVDANEVGIIYHDQKGVLDEVKYEGFQSKSIFEHITTIKTSNKTADIETAGQTKDSIYATFQITIVYRIDAQNAGKFFKKTSATDISQEQLNSLSKEALQAATIKYDVYGVLGEELETVRQDFVTKLSQLAMERYFITIVSASFNDIDAGERIEESIRQKGEAMQQIEIAEANKQRAEVEAATALIEANAQAEVIRIQAQADADKVELAKTAIANMITYYCEAFPTLTEKEVAEIIMETVFYETWDGKLPDVVAGDALGGLLGSVINQTNQ